MLGWWSIYHCAMPIVRKTIGLLLGISAIGGFVLGVWMGLVRLGWSLGFPPSIGAHGPLLVLAILGTLIGAERAVALGKSWVWIGPITSALAAVAIVAGALGADLEHSTGSTHGVAARQRLVDRERQRVGIFAAYP